jgi:hypothetical protein
MSISDLFNKKVVTVNSLEEATSSVESPDLIKQINKKNKTFYPNVNFADPGTFVHFGSAAEYYKAGIERIYTNYPYDGSEAEKLEFQNNSTYLDRWLYDNKYPKSTGYALLSAAGWGDKSSTVGQYGIPTTKEYIYSSGGTHSASIDQHQESDSIGSKDLKDVFDKGVKYDTNKNRTTNFRMKMDDGLTIQFWLKKSAFTTDKTDKEVILDLWNSNVVPSGDNAVSHAHNYGRLTLELSGGLATSTTGSAVYLTLQSGSNGIVNDPISAPTYNATSVANDAWQHHTVTVKASNQQLEVRYFIDGLLNQVSTFPTTLTLGEIPGRINGQIGALLTKPSGSTYASATMLGAGKLSGSIDDFRYWKKALDDEYIYNTWNYPIGGGVNTDDYRTYLGVYYKFNEGITNTGSYDSVVLDYSGRIANGVWTLSTGYDGAISRNTGSAFTIIEPEDPIIRSTHSSVQTLLTEMQESGSLYDRTNSSNLYDTVPAWLIEEDEANSNIKHLYQILSSYLDTLYVQIEELPKLREKNYFSASAEPYFFVERLLSDQGLITPNSFVEGSVLEQFWDRDSSGNHYEQNIEKTKRLIYNNIYNNIEYILKTKGTEKSFRNLLRCYGVDDELIKLNVYTDNGTHYLKDRYKNSSIKTKVLNLNKANRTHTSVTQTSSSINSYTFTSGSGNQLLLEKNSAFSIEAGVTFPKKKEFHQNGYFSLASLSSSLMGFHQPNTGSSAVDSPNASELADYAWSAIDAANIQVYAVRASTDSPRVKFVVSSSNSNIYAESEYYENVYDAQRWNFQLCVKPDGYPFAGSFSTDTVPTDGDFVSSLYEIELYGVTHDMGDVRHEFTISSSVSYDEGKYILCEPKRFYMGAHRTNFTGSVLSPTDVVFDSLRVWMDKLSDEAIKQHNLDPLNYGHNKIFDTTTPFNAGLKKSVQIPAADSLIMHWNFDQNSSANATGSLYIEDFSSGSTDTKYSWASNIIEREHRGVAVGLPNNDTNPVKSEFIFARRKELPEISFTDDRITIFGNKEELFLEDEDTTDNVFALEKSMYQTISEEMARTFSTMKEYANMFAKPVDAYRMEYKKLRIVRGMFFDRIEQKPDLDQYSSYFKWIDSSLSYFIEQLKPASVTFTKGVSNVVESHLFERPKYERKFPTLERKTATQGNIVGVRELTYNWKFGHSPEYKTTDENTNCLWQKDRRERSGPASGQRDTIRDIYTTKTKAGNYYIGDNTGAAYLRSKYIHRNFSRPYKLGFDLSNTLHGGINYNQQKNRNFVNDVVRPHGTKTNLGIPVNVFTVGVGATKGLTNTGLCFDELDPNKTVEFEYTMIAGKDSSGDGSAPATASLEYAYKVKGHLASPFNLISGSVSKGANKKVYDGYNTEAVVTNLHSDTTYFENDIPMQGPFTETWVGGHQSRHVEINKYDTNKNPGDGNVPRNNLDGVYSRPEAWRLLFGEHPSELTKDGAFGFVGADYGGPYPDNTRKMAVYYRGPRTKRPYSIGNISGSDNRLGNYRNNYEYFNSVGRLENNTRLKKAASTEDYLIDSLFLPTDIKAILPATTNPLTLVAIAPSGSGNVFGQGESNRLNDNLEMVTDGVSATGSFQVTSSTTYLQQWTGSVVVQGIPKAATHSYLSWKVASHSSLSNADVLQLTASGVNKQYEIDTAGAGYLTDTDRVITTYRKAIGASGTNVGLPKDVSYNGIGTDDFSISFWHNNVNSDTNSSTYMRFYEGGSLRHQINFDDDIIVTFENTADTLDSATFNVNTATSLGGTWNHYIITFEVSDLSSGVPKLFLNGASVSSTGFSAIGGTTPEISRFYIAFDNFHAFQDVTIWKTPMTGSTAVAELYNGGVWKSPTTHNSASCIIDYYQFGEEDDWNTIGYKVGDTFDDIGGNITRTISSSFGTGQNNLTLSTSYDEDLTFVKGKGELTNDEIWNKLTSSLNQDFPSHDASYISGSQYAYFFLRATGSGVENVGITEIGSSFIEPKQSPGQAAFASTLKHGDIFRPFPQANLAQEIQISHTTFRGGYVGSTADENVANHRKALRFDTSGTSATMALTNTSYTATTDATAVSVSFWLNKHTPTTGLIVTLGDGPYSSDGIFIQYQSGKLNVKIGNGSAQDTAFDVTFGLNEWKHVTLTAYKNLATDPKLWIDGEPQSVDGDYSNVTTPLASTTQIAIGDLNASSGTYELQGALQDFVVWNTQLTNEDAMVLYNSGSWLDISSHASASHIWDWWTFGEEGNIAQNSGSALSTGTAVTSISPEVGRHSLTVSDNTEIIVTDGIVETLMSNSSFWQGILNSFNNNLGVDAQPAGGGGDSDLGYI